MRAPSLTSIETIYGVPYEDMPSRYEHVVLSTPGSDFVISCDPDSDEIVLSQEKKEVRGGVAILNGQFHVAWTWMLTNHQGYTDGLRVEVTSDGISRSFDFIAAASAIEVYESKRTEANRVPVTD